MRNSSAKGSKRYALPRFNNHLNDKELPGYTKLSISIDAISWSCIMNSGTPAYFRRLGINEKYEDVIPFFILFQLIFAWHTLLLSEQSVLFQRDMI